MLAAIQTSNKALRTSVESKISNLRKDNNKLQSSVETTFASLQEHAESNYKKPQQLTSSPKIEN
jgi:hypothetical protein